MPEAITFIDPDGGSTTIHNWPTVTDNAVLMGVEGLFSPPFDLIGDEVPLEAGERVTEVRTERRTLVLPFRIYAATETALRTAVRGWVTRFNPALGDSVIRWTGPDATSRDLNVRLSSGTEGQIDPANTGMTEFFQTLVLTFRAPDPWWYDTSTSTQAFSGGAAGSFFPFFPLSVSGSAVLGEATITNDGDTYAWPTITITGPATDPVVRNVTTGKLLDFTGVTLTAGQSITIDTTPGVKTVLRNDGTNFFPELTATSSLWRLQRGSNQVRAEASSTTSDSRVDLSWRRRWLSA